MFELLALICAALFAGAALYTTFAERPERLALDDAPLAGAVAVLADMQAFAGVVG